MNAHRPVVLLTVLPKERRARHPYQLCLMLALITIGVSQLTIGPPAGAAISHQPEGTQDMLNWFCVLAGLAGVFAAVVPERIIRWKMRDRERSFDATWVRLVVEGACHGLLFFVWAAYFVTIFVTLPFYEGLSLGSGLAFWLGVAAAVRAGQILWTVKRAVIDPPQDSAIISENDAPDANAW